MLLVVDDVEALSSLASPACAERRFRVSDVALGVGLEELVQELINLESVMFSFSAGEFGLDVIVVFRSDIHDDDRSPAIRAVLKSCVGWHIPRFNPSWRTLYSSLCGGMDHERHSLLY